MSSKVDQVNEANNFEEIVTLEDHLVDGGFGSWMMESMVGKPEVIARIKVHALKPVVCGTVGSQLTLNTLGGIGTSVS
jgi:transketolase